MTEIQSAQLSQQDTAPLAARLHGPVYRRGERGYGEALAGFQTGVSPDPLAVVTTADGHDVAGAVAFAAAGDLPIGVRATGHGLSVPADGGILLDTSGLGNVVVDPAGRTARIAAGARMGAVLAAAAPHGLAPVSGSFPGVGAVGYTLSGGYGLLGRAFGFAADYVRALEVVTANGARRWPSRCAAGTCCTYGWPRRAVRSGPGRPSRRCGARGRCWQATSASCRSPTAPASPASRAGRTPTTARTHSCLTWIVRCWRRSWRSLGRSASFVYGRRAPGEEAHRVYDPATLARLRGIKRRYDPTNVFRATHAVAS